MAESNSLVYVTKMNQLVATRIKVKRDQLAKLSAQITEIDREIVELQEICPHLVQTSHPRQIAEDNSYSTCDTCGKAIY